MLSSASLKTSSCLNRSTLLLSHWYRESSMTLLRWWFLYCIYHFKVSLVGLFSNTEGKGRCSKCCKRKSRFRRCRRCFTWKIQKRLKLKSETGRDKSERVTWNLLHQAASDAYAHSFSSVELIFVECPTRGVPRPDTTKHRNRTLFAASPNFVTFRVKYCVLQSLCWFSYYNAICTSE